MLFYIGFAVIALLIAVFLIRAWLTKRRIIQAFRSNNVLVFGKKGKGKDLIFQEVIATRKAPYLSNIDYGGKRLKEVWPNELSVTPNTYENFIANEVATLEKKDAWEDIDAYISDMGVILPSQMDSLLHKKFPSFPIYYALSRHLYNSNIHGNTQNLERAWKAIREQADYFVQARGVINLGFCLIVRTTEYDKYKSAVAELSPVKGGGLFNSFRKAETAIYNATNGFIKDGYLIVWKRHIKYDTRAYHEKIFGSKAPSKKKIRRSRASEPIPPEGGN